MLYLKNYQSYKSKTKMKSTAILCTKTYKVFWNDRPNSTSKVSFQTNMKKYDLLSFYEKNKCKTIKAIDLNHKLKVARICVVAPSKFSEWSTTQSERSFSLDGHKNQTFFGKFFMYMGHLREIGISKRITFYMENVVLPVTNMMNFIIM